MVTNSRCPACGAVEDSRRSTYGQVICPGCSERYWIPAEVFASAPYSERTVDGIDILGVYFDDALGYRVLVRNGYGQYAIGRRYDPFRGFWLGGDYFDDLTTAEANLRGFSKVGGV